MKLISMGRFLLPDRDVWPTWASLRGVGNSPAVRASIVVPVIGYLIILNSTFADYLKLHGIEWSHEPITAWDRVWGLKLYLIYFGLMFLGLGAVVYQWKCPHFVKKYSDWTDYIAGMAPYMDGEIEMLADMVGADYPADRLMLHEVRQQDLLRRYLRRDYSQMSTFSLPWRITATILFGLGFLLLAIPSAMTAVRVAIALVQ
jgi:hypothetical protein